MILSACDTAGLATVSASREAGVASGGNYALDGLVRAFVGAGARSVVASHWPVPDDYGATRRLMAGLLGGRARTLWVASAWAFHLGVLAFMAVLFPYPLLGLAFAPLFRLERLPAALASPVARRRRRRRWAGARPVP